MKLSEVLTDKSKWIQHAYATDKKGSAAQTHSEVACRFCLLGAAEKAWEKNPHMHPETLDDWYAFLVSIKEVIAELYPERFNPCVHDQIMYQSMSGITGFNDHRDTNFDDVQLVIKTVENKSK